MDGGREGGVRARGEAAGEVCGAVGEYGASCMYLKKRRDRLYDAFEFLGVEQ